MGETPTRSRFCAPASTKLGMGRFGAPLPHHQHNHHHLLLPPRDTWRVCRTAQQNDMPMSLCLRVEYV
jgi:hypothetical protein